MLIYFLVENGCKPTWTVRDPKGISIFDGMTRTINTANYAIEPSQWKLEYDTLIIPIPTWIKRETAGREFCNKIQSDRVYFLFLSVQYGIRGSWTGMILNYFFSGGLGEGFTTVACYWGPQPPIVSCGCYSVSVNCFMCIYFLN